MRPIKVLGLILALAFAAFAQTNKGSISGTVTDPNGAAVAGASVTVINRGTNQKITQVTPTNGGFTVSFLDPVNYNIIVEAKGFKRTVMENIKVDTATAANADVVLEVGEATAELTVSAEASLLNTESGTTTHTITERQIQDVPLNNRSVLDLAVTSPNVSGDAGSEDPEVTSGQPVPGFNLSLNGGRPGSTTILADGVNNTGVGLARAVVSFTPETVQEFTVQTSAYSAEYGQTGGGVINISTKPGSNDFRGTALVYHRNPYTNAQPYRIGTTPRTANNLRYTQGSLSFGGPVYLPRFGEGGPKLYDGHNKTFFFFAYEPRWRQDFVTTTTLLPTAAERAGDFRNLVRSSTSGGWIPADVAARFGITSANNNNIYQQFTLNNGRLVPIVLTGSNQYCQFGDTRAILVNGQPQCTAATNAAPINSLNVIPSQFIDPIASKLLQFMPTGGEYFLDNGLVRNYVIDRSVLQNETRYTLRLDHNFTDANKANFRYTLTPAIGVRGFGSDVNGNTGVYSDAKQFLIGDTHIFSPKVVNDLRLSYTRGVFSEDFSPEFSIKGGRNLATELGLPSLTAGGIPLFQISGDGGTNGIQGYTAFSDVGSSGSTNNFNVEERFSIDDTVNWARGSQNWKFGVNLSYARLNVIPFFGASGGRWEFRTLNTSNNRGTGLTNGGNNLASLLLGVPNAVQVRPLLLNYDYRWKGGALFAQNDWRVRPNLTVNLGFRYSLQYPRTEKNNLQGVFRPDLAQNVTLTDAQRRATATGLGIPTTSAIPDYVPTTVQLPAFAFAGRGGRSRFIVPIDYRGFEPRFGFAWSPKMSKWFADHNSVIRGGYGLSHAPITGNNRNPNPDFGSFTAVSTLANGSTVGGTSDATQPVRLSGNAPFINGVPIDTVLGTNSEGLVFLNSLGVPGVADAGPDSGKVPYTQNWNLTLQFEPFKNTVVEVAYVGSKGTHLYMPLVNINPKNTSFVELLEGNNLNSETTFADPLGRRNLLGAVIAIQRNSVASPYFGFNNLNRFFDPSANSIRHAAYVDLRRRIARGVTFTANYTYGKSIDDASDASPDVRVLTSGSTLGQVSYGAPRSGDRSISTFDIKHNFSSTFVWDLPFGRKRTFFKGAPAAVDALVGGWSLSGLVRLQGGQPFLPFITDTNRLGGTNRTVRLDIVPGVSIKNPLYSAGNCSIGAACEPYINPAAFQRPVKGSLGSAPRTLDVRSPLQEYFDFSIQKTFNMPFIGNEGKRRIQLRMDLINAFNHPNFRFNNTGNTPPGFGTFPTELTTETEAVTLPNGTAGTRFSVITTAEYNAWATVNNRPLSTTPEGATLLSQIRATVNAVRLPNNVAVNAPNSALPLDFFHVRLPEGFASRNANSFDITTLEGFRLYRVRQSYDANFGTLFAVNNPRYIQLGLKIYF